MSEGFHRFEKAAQQAKNSKAPEFSHGSGPQMPKGIQNYTKACTKAPNNISSWRLEDAPSLHCGWQTSDS